MAEPALVTAGLPDGAATLRVLDRKGFPVHAALWLLDQDAGSWRFVIGSTLVDEMGRHESYQRLQEALRSAKQPVSIRDIVLVGANDPFLSALSSTVRVSGISMSRLSNLSFNGAYVADAMVYRLEAPTEPGPRPPKPTKRTNGPTTNRPK